MIRCDRASVPVPTIFAAPRVQRARARLEAVFHLDVAQRPQSSVFETFMLKGARGALRTLFHRKCAYCETPLESDWHFGIDAYRPHRLSGDPDARDHYWWLAYEWTNLLPACAECSAAKGSWFPILGERAHPPPEATPLAEERPLLIDPSVDEPAAFLWFRADGRVEPRADAKAETLARANTSIELLQLNRPALQTARQANAAELEAIVASVINAPPSARLELATLLHDALGERLPYAATRRCTVAAAWAKLERALAGHPDLAAALRGTLQPWLPAEPRAEARPAAAAAPEPVGADAPRKRFMKLSRIRRPPDAELRSAPRLATISAVKIENFRLIEHLNFTVPARRPEDLENPLFAAAMENAPEPEDAADDLPGRPPRAETIHRTWGWKMLLGENGAGKSSILQAIALALGGEAFFRRMGESYGLDRSLRTGAAQGRIEVQLAQFAEPLVVEISPDGLRWPERPFRPSFFLRAYGATRLLPGRPGVIAAEPPARPPLQRIDNLFDPFAPLIDAEGWLRHLEEHDFFNACRTLRHLLMIEDDANLVFELEGHPRRGRFGLRHDGHFTPLDQFSAGYQTVLALACDIMAGVGSRVDEMRSVPGIVLIDEVGTNLHPRWRMSILQRLERAFPEMQFIASTHEPLCLRGLGQGEVAVVQREGARIALRDQLPSPAGLRIDQLLTSEFFGLHTTIDPETEQAFDIYYDLLARDAELDAAQRRARDDYAARLNRSSVLGTSRRDQFILRVVDEFLARQPRTGAGEALPEPSPEVRRLIERALSELELPGDTAPP